MADATTEAWMSIIRDGRSLCGAGGASSPRVCQVGTSTSGELCARWLCTTMASDGDRLRQTQGGDDDTTEAAGRRDGADHDRAAGGGAGARQGDGRGDRDAAVGAHQAVDYGAHETSARDGKPGAMVGRSD